MKHRASTYRIKVFSGVEGLAELEDDWRSIIDSCSHSSFYQMYGWYHAYLGCLEQNPQDVFFFLVKNEHKALSIIPLKRENHYQNGLKLHIWISPRTDEMPLCDFVTDDENSIVPQFQAVLDELKLNDKYKFDVIMLRRVLEGGNAWHLISDCAIRNKIVLHHSFSKYLICNTDSKGAVVIGSSKFRRNLRRLEKRLNGKGEVEWQYVCDIETLNRAFSSFMDVEGSGWKGQGGANTAIKNNPRIVAFYKEMLTSFGVLGRCRINLLKLNGKVIAGQYCLQDNGRINLLKIGFDESYKDCSPGYVLIRKVLEKGCVSGDYKELSFVTGAEWNDIFRPEKKHVYSVYIYNKTIKGLLFAISLLLKQKIKKLLNRS